MSRLISTNDTAKLIRKALKDNFPDTKFGVRSKKYSGGSSITVSYTDGPPYKAVKKVAERFEGASFDGMRDLKEYKTHVDENGEMVHYGPDFVFVNRDYSDAATYWATRYVLETQHLTVWRNGELTDWDGEGDYNKESVMIGQSREYVDAYARTRILQDLDLS